MNRRSVIAGLGVAGLASLSGCLGLIGMAEHESSPAGVEAAAREETGYEQTEIEELSIERDVGPTNETVTVINYMTKHEKQVGIMGLGERRAAIYNVLTTPQVNIFGRELNPVGEMSTQELIDLVRSNYDGINDISHEGDSDVTILDQSTTQSRFSADATFDGQELAVDIHITEAVEADDDLLVTIGVYPQRLQSQERPNIATLTESVTTDVDPDDSTGGSEDGGNSDSNESDDGSGDNKSDDGSGDNESDDGVLG
ncbi:hypothetical protein CP556_02315 [Natrinema sp. CBA1119]|uniref:DUF6517 family protein n=1 Tax=Natrinema sp. CBA1119 TaxID=1608465 RepID=UPI000BF58932|nr:DUF6517 family protein [Natrinema sp. CBA1119]PGF18194.1 hypothetical protein CP556_02315 [Natrinema sp. CBA1119]